MVPPRSRTPSHFPSLCCQVLSQNLPNSLQSGAVPKPSHLVAVRCWRPAMPKNTTQKNVPYIREKSIEGSRGLRKDQIKWKRSLPEILNAGDKGIIKLLVADKLLPDWTGTPCPRCCKGTLSHLMQFRGNCWKHKCSVSACRAWINPYHLHPLFSEKTGSTTTKYLQTQASMLLLHLHPVPQATIQSLLGVNHKAVESMQMKLFDLRRNYVEFEQKNIIFGEGKTWKDVEADEACFDKKEITNGVQFHEKEGHHSDVGAMGRRSAARFFEKPRSAQTGKKLTVKCAPGPIQFFFYFSFMFVLLNSSTHRRISSDRDGHSSLCFIHLVYAFIQTKQSLKSRRTYEAYIHFPAQIHRNKMHTRTRSNPQEGMGGFGKQVSQRQTCNSPH